jgi:mRNA interferase MazF
VRSIHLARVASKTRPVVLMTRDSIIDLLTNVTVAPITSTVRGIPTEVPVGSRNGLDKEGVISCDNLMTIAKTDLGRAVGLLLDDQESALAAAVRHAFDLRL